MSFANRCYFATIVVQSLDCYTRFISQKNLYIIFPVSFVCSICLFLLFSFQCACPTLAELSALERRKMFMIPRGHLSSVQTDGLLL